MNPNIRSNRKVVFDKELSEDGKIRGLTQFIETDIDPDDYQGSFSSLMARVKQYASPLDGGLDPLDMKPTLNPVDYQTEQLVVRKVRGGKLALQFYVYEPAEKCYSPSLLAKWHLLNKTGQQPILQEYLSSKFLDPSTPNSRALASGRLALLEESLDAYERTLNMPKTLFRNIGNKALDAIFKFWG